MCPFQKVCPSERVCPFWFWPCSCLDREIAARARDIDVSFSKGAGDACVAPTGAGGVGHLSKSVTVPLKGCVPFGGAVKKCPGGPGHLGWAWRSFLEARLPVVGCG